jgi:hypothetical protein
MAYNDIGEIQQALEWNNCFIEDDQVTLVFHGRVEREIHQQEPVPGENETVQMLQTSQGTVYLLERHIPPFTRRFVRNAEGLYEEVTGA